MGAWSNRRHGLALARRRQDLLGRPDGDILPGGIRQANGVENTTSIRFGSACRILVWRNSLHPARRHPAGSTDVILTRSLLVVCGSAVGCSTRKTVSSGGAGANARGTSQFAGLRLPATRQAGQYQHGVVLTGRHGCKDLFHPDFALTGAVLTSRVCKLAAVRQAEHGELLAGCRL